MITYRQSNSMMDAFRSIDMMKDLNGNYPDFYNWYVNKAIPDVVSRDGIMMIAEDDFRIVGISLAKMGDDKKLRCLRISPEFQNKGVGIHLMDRTLKAMNEDKPFVTVSENYLHAFSRIFVNRFDFDLTKVEKGLYKPGVLEYVFNGKQNLREKTAY